MTTLLRHRPRGVVLPVVLVLLMLISGLASSFATRNQVEGLVFRNTAQAIFARGLAEGGVYWGIGHILTSQSTETALLFNDVAEIELDGESVSVLISDESGKVDINAAPDVLLRNLLLQLEFEEAQAGSLVDAILDWRDEDDLARLNGAEADGYAAAGLAYGPQNRPYLSLEELNQIVGLDREIYFKLRPYVTVWSTDAKIFPDAAPEAVLRAIPEIRDEHVSAFVAAREMLIEGGGSGGLPGLAGDSELVTSQPGEIYQVIAFTRTRTNAVAAVEAVVRIPADGSGRYEILRIGDADAATAYWLGADDGQGDPSGSEDGGTDDGGHD